MSETYCGICLLLLAIRVNRKTVEDDLVSVLHLGWARRDDRSPHGKELHAVFDDFNLECGDAGHLDGTRGFAVAETEVDVTDRQVGALDVDGQVDARTSYKVASVDITTVLESH